MKSPEYEKTGHQDETGFSEKQLDIAIEVGVFKKKSNKKIKKILFEKRANKW